MTNSNTECLVIDGRCIFCDRPDHLQATDSYTCSGPEASIDGNIWHIKDAKELPKWAWPLTEEESTEFSLWLNTFDGVPFEPSPTRQLQHFAEIRNVALPPYRPRTDVLPGMLSEAFFLNGPIELGNRTRLYWLIARGNYEPGDAQGLINSAGFQVSKPEMYSDLEKLIRQFGMKPKKEVRTFADYMADELIPTDAVVLVQIQLR